MFEGQDESSPERLGSQKYFGRMKNGPPRLTFEKLFHIDSSVSTKIAPNFAFKRSDSDNSILSTILSSSSSDDSWLEHSFLTQTPKAVSSTVIDLTGPSPESALTRPKPESSTNSLGLLCEAPLKKTSSTVRTEKASANTESLAPKRLKLTKDLIFNKESKAQKTETQTQTQTRTQEKTQARTLWTQTKTQPIQKPTRSESTQTSTKPKSNSILAIEIDKDLKVSRSSTSKRKTEAKSETTNSRTTKKSPASSTKSKTEWNTRGSTKKRKREEDIPNDDLWIDKYKPLDQATLCVVKKKYEEVLDALTLAFKGNVKVIFLVGPPGCGKSACMGVICRLTKVEKVEWSNPTQIANSDISFTSIMAPFTDFVIREKYPTLDFSGRVENTRKGKQKVVVIEDIPNLHDFKQQQEFVSVVESIVHSRSTPLGPVVFIISDTTKKSNAVIRIMPESILNSTFVKQIRFNGVTMQKSMAILRRIAEKENLDITVEQLKELTANSDGDIRNAVNSLQFSFVPGGGKEIQLKSRRSKKEKSVEPKEKTMAKTGRDSSLSLFHALGKVLYNKRLPALETCSDSRFRAPMKSEPSKFRKYVDVESTLFSQFIAENYLHFFSDIHEAAQASDYLSDRQLYLGSSININSVCMVASDKAQQYSKNVDLDLQSWFVATTGVMYSNTKPFPPTFQAFYKPHVYTVNRVRKNNKEIMRQLYTSLAKIEEAQARIHAVESKILSTDVLPFLSKLCKRKTQGWQQPGSVLKPSLFDIHLTQSQREWIDMIGNYSNNPYSTNIGVERGSMKLTEFDNYYKVHAQTPNPKLLTTTLNAEMLKKMNDDTLAEDDIEESSD